VLVYLFNVARKDRLLVVDINVLEGGSAFWHLVDILWIVLFAMFYLMR
jgi:nitric oxide reductase NorE protein